MSIIGISGKIGSGKDLVGNIINYLIFKKTVEGVAEVASFTDFPKDSNGNIDISSFNSIHLFEVKKFADTLKDMTCLLLGCTREQLEDRAFKETILGEEWIRYGKAEGFFQHNGKTTMNNEPCSKEEYEKELKVNWQTAYKLEHTPRTILQMLGTQCGRFIHPNIWVNALFSKYNDTQNWVITDVRFPNELKVIEERKGITIRLERDLPCTVCSSTLAERKGNFCYDIICPNGQPKHESETALDDATFDYVIHNTGTIEELVLKIDEILTLENIYDV